MLSVQDLHAGYGSLQVLRGLSFDVAASRTVAILGGNGVGKTTTMKTLAGLIRATRGRILLDGVPIEGMATHRIFGRGLALVPQGRELFPEMTVRENIEAGCLAAHLGRSELAKRVDSVLDLFPRLSQRARERAASLSGGEQQMLVTGRALVCRPRLLLLDEPTTGLAPLIVQELVAIMQRLNDAGQTILLVEQNVEMVRQIASEAYVMRAGTVVDHKHAAAFGSLHDVFDLYTA